MTTSSKAATELKSRKHKSYPKYKDSGVDWLGKIPADWEIRKLKHVSTMCVSNVDKKSVEGEQSVRLCNYVDVYYSDYITDEIEFMEATATPEQVCRLSLKRGDVLITKDSETWEDIAVPAVVDANLEGVLCGYHLAQIRPKHGRSDGEYLFRAFSSQGIREQFFVEANGITRYGLTKDAIASGLFPIPPFDEQRAIAEFLRCETAKIDALIEKKQRLIELLQEKRTALISHAVTKGLDPDARMKDSGIEWLGEIPEHWQVKRLKNICHINLGVIPETTAPEYELLYVDIGNVSSTGEILEEEPMLFENAPSSAFRK